jgi:hypothetical protein
VTTISRTTVSLCQGQYQLDYSLNLINQSYPLLAIQSSIEGECPDAQFGQLWKNALFFQVSENRTQLTVYDYRQKRLFVMDQLSDTPS